MSAIIYQVSLQAALHREIFLSERRFKHFRKLFRKLFRTIQKTSLKMEDTGVEGTCIILSEHDMKAKAVSDMEV